MKITILEGTKDDEVINDNNIIKVKCKKSFQIMEHVPFCLPHTINIGEKFEVSPKMSEAFYPQIILSQGSRLLSVDGKVLEEFFERIEE